MSEKLVPKLLWSFRGLYLGEQLQMCNDFATKKRSIRVSVGINRLNRWSIPRGEKVPFTNVPEFVRIHRFGPLGPVGLNEKALNQESEAINSYSGLRTFASLEPKPYENLVVVSGAARLAQPIV